MQLLPLGRMAGMPAGGQASSGYLVSSGGTTVMLDAGPGTAVGLSAALAGTRPDAVVVSHLHTDHLLDLLPIGKMVLNQRLHLDPTSGRTELAEVPPVPLLVPSGATATLREWAALFPVTSNPVLDRAFELGFEVVEYQPGDTFAVGGLRLHWRLLEHVAPNCGTRLEAPDGTSLVYSGDTGVTPALADLAADADLLLCESTLRSTDRSGHGHLTSTEAGQAAQEAGVGRLTLTHFASPDPDQHEWHRARAAEVFDGPVGVAHVGEVVPIGALAAATGPTPP
ncbi:MBL fold metallo-hydrolase [Desertihabitans brevis]|uniref:MBL fold metallo-hydrolase n=1 Tax=Desertihabitans brevis TaxID=2268447 RepID=A0A367YZA8_9ACTN|nr:MBL fold metallo-hydrolase [Desertihabitans brevis]RCK70342.1 MBL fold metallo-hydrolase [Desertihabitans brevis]